MAIRRWKSGEKPTAIFATTHKDRTGGGELYAHQFAKQLDALTDMRYFTGNTGGLHSDFRKYHGSTYRFTATALLHRADIYVNCSHFFVGEPAGQRRNVVLTFFPNAEHKEAVRPFDSVVTCSTFSAQWVKKYWRKKATVIHPFIDIQNYTLQKKKRPKSICNVGRFFREPHGHSKKQDVLIEGLARLHQTDSEWELHLAGSVLSPSDQEYVSFCKDRAKTLGVDRAVTFHENMPFGDLAGLYADCSTYWHSNGYGSKNPYETEHFGIVIAEGMASGCTPIIYANGGYEDFPALTWETPEELAEITRTVSHDPQRYRDYVAEHFSEEQMALDVKNLFFRS